jgi:putative hydrolase
MKISDHHVHSSYSDGQGTLADNIAVALSKGLQTLGCVDHVRRTTPWLPLFTADIDALRKLHPELELRCGVEAKLLTQAGDIDVPQDLRGVDHVYIADHQLPLGDTCLGPREVRSLLACNAVTEQQLIAAIVSATCGAMSRHRGSVIAHLFSILPKIGLSEAHVSTDSLCQLAQVARDTGASLELDERWTCPGPRIAGVFQAYEVPILSSSDAHRPHEIARYQWMPLHLTGNQARSERDRSSQVVKL